MNKRTEEILKRLCAQAYYGAKANFIRVYYEEKTPFDEMCKAFNPYTHELTIFGACAVFALTMGKVNRILYSAIIGRVRER